MSVMDTESCDAVWQVKDEWSGEEEAGWRAYRCRNTAPYKLSRKSMGTAMKAALHMYWIPSHSTREQSQQRHSKGAERRM